MDLDPWDVTFEVLKKIPLDNIKFSVILYEHDGYRSGDEFKTKNKNIFRILRLYLIHGVE